MKTKELKVYPPKGYEIDKENSTFECIKFKKKEFTYKDVAKALFTNNERYFIDSWSNISCTSSGNDIFDGNNATSQKQLEKLLAINKLMNVAKYLNDGWKPDWDTQKEHKYYIYINYINNNIGISYCTVNGTELVYFPHEAEAQQAIDILGEDTIRLALSTDW